MTKHPQRSRDRMRLFLGVSLALCLVLLGITLFRGDALGAAVEDNLLRLRLERVLHAAPAPADAGLLQQLRAPGFATDNPRVAWLSGYYLLGQTFSYAAAQRLWAMAPAYAAEMLVWYATVTPDQPERLRAATTAAALAPAALPARRAQVDALIANEQWSAAADELDRLLAAWPDDADLNALRGRVEWRGGGAVEKAKAWLERAMALEPANMLAPGYMIEYYRSHGKPGEMEAFLKQILMANKTPELNSGFYANLAELYMHQGDLTAAQYPLNAALALDPKNFWINGLAGNYYLLTGQYAQAIRSYSESLLSRKNADYYVGIGDAHWAQGDRENAALAYCDAFALDNQHVAARKRLSEQTISCP